MYCASFTIKKSILSIVTIMGLSLMLSCKDDTAEPVVTPEKPKEGPKVIVTPSIEYQEMIGFGGALTWYSDRVVSSSKSDEIYKLMFQDLGMDILRLKNWYYPLDYPQNKSPQTMLSSGDKIMFEATNTFYAKAKEYNPNIKVLLSSWGPPPALKSNNHLREGTLKKDEQGYMYDAFADYWVDALNNIAFSPDYISIQNEPGYVNAGWTTCKWSPTETASLAGYEEAFVRVHEKIKDRTNAPLMIGPESENIQEFMRFAPVVKDKSYCPFYAYHPYNFNSGTDISQATSLLNNLWSNFGNKPNLMTEYSAMSWFKTARFINKTMKHANTSGYVYWELVWGDPATKDNAMIFMDGSGYTVNSFYYVIKHYAKFIDQGYKRVEVAAGNSSLEVTAYMKPDQSQLTLIVINPASAVSKYAVEVEGRSMKALKAYQSVQGNYFKDLGSLQVDGVLILPALSITTVVVDL